MGHQHHQIRLKHLRSDEEILHNCSSHPLIHLKQPFWYLMGLLIPLIGLILLDRNDFFEASRTLVWFLYTCYGLVWTTAFFVKGVNFQLGGCVITNQRVLRFGYKGLAQAVEREILPNKIEDFKIEKKGLFSLIFGTANIYIHTSNDQIDVLRHVIQPVKIQDAYAKMVRAHGTARSSHSSTPTEKDSQWIDDALEDSDKGSFDLENHRKGMIGNIGNVFKKNQK